MYIYYGPFTCLQVVFRIYKVGSASISKHLRKTLLFPGRHKRTLRILIRIRRVSINIINVRSFLHASMQNARPLDFLQLTYKLYASLRGAPSPLSRCCRYSKIAPLILLRIRGAFFLISVALSNVRSFLHASMQNARPLDKSLYVTSFRGHLQALRERVL